MPITHPEYRNLFYQNLKIVGSFTRIFTVSVKSVIDWKIIKNWFVLSVHNSHAGLFPANFAFFSGNQRRRANVNSNGGYRVITVQHVT